jgi:hypothetical protein
MTDGGTAHRLADAMRARDFDTIGDLLAQDVVLNSPITAAFRFHGRDEILDLLRAVRDVYETLEYTAIFGSGDTWAQVFRTTIRGTPMEGTDIMRLDEDGRVREFTVFFRPLPGLATLAAALGPAVAPTRPRAIALRALAAPLAAATRLGERIVPRLAGR